MNQNDGGVGGGVGTPEAPTPGEALLRTMIAEMQVRFGPVPDHLPGMTVLDEAFAMTCDSLLFRTPGGVAFHYRRGEGVVAHLPDEGLLDEYDLYLRGTVFGAVAWLNGYCPLHASAVVVEGRAIAFTADSGAGKSTLAAALSNRPGFAHLCDDTLVLDVRADGITAMPDGKPLKLWDDAFALAGAARQSAILTVPGKFYASAAQQAEAPAILTDLVFLEDGERLRLEPLIGAGKLSLLAGALYRAFVHTMRGDTAAHARMMTQIAGNVRFWRLTRSRNLAKFTMNIEEIERLVRETMLAD
jgi:hypothetical protein